MKRLKKGDMVVFLQNYKDLVQKGETRPIDKATYVDGVLQSVYVKAETNYIYLSGGDFEWFCKPYENKNVECKLIDEILKQAEKHMKDEELAKAMLAEVKPYDYINPNHYKQGSKEVIEMMQDIWGKEKLIAYCEMNSFKYRMRAGLKPEQSVQRDLEKAKWYEDKAIQLRNEQK